MSSPTVRSGAMLLRTITERATHRLVIRRRLPAPFEAVRIYASSEGGLRYLRLRLKGVDQPLLRLVEEVVRADHVVWDIGANLGLFSFSAAATAGPSGHVLAVEPDSVLVGLLRRSAASNHDCAKVVALPAAVSNKVGVAQFNIAKRNRSTNYLNGFGTTQTGGIRTTQLVVTVTLDWLAANFQLPDIIKIDVEEAELDVLLGGAAVLRTQPTIICEVAAHNSVRVGELLSAYGYKLYDGEQPPDRRIPMTIAPPNTLALGAATPRWDSVPPHSRRSVSNK